VVIAHAYVDGERVIVARPDGTSFASLSLDIADVLGRARASAAACCLLRPPALAHDPRFELIPSGVRRINAEGLSGGWLRAQWRVAAALDTIGAWSRRVGESFWREWYRELRRHIGDERLPYPLRLRLRGTADRALARSNDAARRLGPRPLPRRDLRERVPVALEPGRKASVERAAARHGIPVGSPLVVLEFHSRLALIEPAVEALLDSGFTVVRIGPSGSGDLTRLGAIDLPSAGSADADLELYLMLAAAFVVCESDSVQHAAYLTGTPCLRLNATEPFSAYPVRHDGLFTLAQAVDGATGRKLPVEDLHGEAYLKHQDGYVHRPLDAGQTRDAVLEMIDGIARGWTESAGQSRYRERVIEAGRALRDRVPVARTWGPDGDFIGDGRLARTQAEAHGMTEPPR
jgi:putative glycosyltransferase (TIGR04372 family)